MTVRTLARNPLVVGSTAVALVVAGALIFTLARASTSNPGCAFSNGATAAFCETFDTPSVNPSSSRSGDLNGTVWGVSRDSGNQNFSSPANGWQPTSGDCGVTNVLPPKDVAVCNGQLQEAVSDGGTVTTLAMYPKQPFDFAGRTGHVVFDVSNNSQGSHAAWPEFWMSDQPVPDPFTHEASFLALPQNGFGIRFAGCTDSSGNQVTCSLGSTGIGVDSAITVANHVENDSFNGGSLRVTGLGSVTQSAPGQMNHYEIQVAVNQIDVYATNAFTPGGTVPPLVHIATIANANLSFTRGLVWIEDAHYNGNKFNTQGTHTFTWDNVGFDGPVLPRDLTFDAPDCKCGTATLQNGTTGTNLAYFVGPNASVSVNTLPVTSANITVAAGAAVLFNFWDTLEPFTINLAVNGHSISTPWPYPDTQTGARTLAVDVPLADLISGVNTVTFMTGNYGLNVFNVDLLLKGAGGGGGTTTTVATTQAPTTTTTTTIAPTTTTQMAPTTTTVLGQATKLTCPVIVNPTVGQTVTCTFN